MKNVKFGVFCLGLAGAIGAAVSSLNAQTWTQAVPAEPGQRADRNMMVLDGRGSQLGVMISDLDAKAGTGVRIDEVNEESPAEKAGLKVGDVVVEFDGERVRSARQFTRLVQETPEGKSVAIALLRDGKKQTVNATPENGRMTWNFGPDVERALREAERGTRAYRFDMPNFEFRLDDRERNRDNREPRYFEYSVPPGNVMPMPMPFMGRSRGRLGVQVQSLTRDLEEYFGATNGGALVSGVTPDSAASKAGIKAGDVIVSINGRGVRDSDDLISELDNITGEATIVVLRDKKEMTLKATIEAPATTKPRAGSRPGV
jgi:S1-C subfamily serine protease